jgi:hypothetical protein
LGGILLLVGSILLYRMLKKWKYDVWHIFLKLKNNKEIEDVNLKNYKKLLDKNEDNKIKENKTKIFNIE